MHPKIDKLNKEQLNENLADFGVGDTVKVHTKIVEGGKERIQIFRGTVIARGGADVNETFTVRRVANNVGIERVFPVHSPRVAKVEVETHGDGDLRAARKALVTRLQGFLRRADDARARNGDRGDS